MKLSDPRIQKRLKEWRDREWELLSLMASTGYPMRPAQYDRYRELKRKKEVTNGDK